MTKFIIRRILQAIPTVIGITIIAYFIMDLAPGNPLSQITLDPNLTVEAREAIFEASGFNDPTIVKYFRWLIGDAPIAFGENAAYAVYLNNRETVVVDADTGDILETRSTSEMDTNVTDSGVRISRAGENPISQEDAASLALEANPTAETEVVNTSWLTHYEDTNAWSFHLSNGVTVIVDSRTGRVIEDRPTEVLDADPAYSEAPVSDASSPEVNVDDARDTTIRWISAFTAQWDEELWTADFEGQPAWIVDLSGILSEDPIRYVVSSETGEIITSGTPESIDIEALETVAIRNADSPEVSMDIAQDNIIASFGDEIITETFWVEEYPVVSAWVVELNTGDTLLVSSNEREVLEQGLTSEYDLDTAEAPPEGRDPVVELEDAEALAVNTIPTTRVEWLPYWSATVLWAGRDLPVFQRGQIVGEEVGTDRGVLRGDFGESFVSNKPVTEAIGVRIGATFELGALALLLGTLVGIPVGVLAAVWQGSIFDQVTRIGAVLVSAIPVFWLGLILLLVFGAELGWLPMGNRFPISFTGEYTIWERIQHLILPVFTLSSFTIATFSRFMRASLLNVLNEDYVRTARAKGLSDRKVWFKHALRNAMIPIATILGPSLTNVLAGAVLTETIYSWPGMGRLVVDSVFQQDFPVIMGIVLLSSMLTILGYLISDILYAVFDPRIRLS